MKEATGFDGDTKSKAEWLSRLWICRRKNFLLIELTGADKPPVKKPKEKKP